MIQIFSGRFTKAGRAVRPDPVVDHIMATAVEAQMDPEEIEARLEHGLPMPDNTQEDTQGFVTLMVPTDDGPLGDLPLDLTLNGVRYRLPRNQMATIPKEIAALILHSADIKTEMVPLAGKGERIISKYDFDTGHHSGFSTVDQSRFRVHVERED